MLQALLAECRSMCHGLCTGVSAYYCKSSLQKVGLCIMVYVQVPALKFASSGRRKDVCSTDADCGDLYLQATNAVRTCIYRQQMLWSLVFTGNKCCADLYLQATNAVRTCIYRQQMLIVVTCIYRQQLLWLLVFIGNKC